MRSVIFLLCCFFITPALSEAVDHKQWDELLKEHVSITKDGKSTAVDYQGFFDDRIKLVEYLNELSLVKKSKFNQWHKSEQLAFFINVYNAFTIDYILTLWPDIESIKELGGFFTSPWSKKIIPLFGEFYSLDNIEHDFIRGSAEFTDPRIHFAVNCASIGCPALRQEAYTGAKIEEQLESQAQQFLSDKSRNYLDGEVLKISPIFKWYKKDFEKGWNHLYSLEEFLAYYSKPLHLSEKEKNMLLNKKIDIEFSSYDWRLNKQ